MGIFGRIFSKKPSCKDVLCDCRKDVLELYGITSPTDSQMFTATFALSAAFIGTLNAIGGAALHKSIDDIADVSADLVADLIVSVKDVVPNETELDIILASFPGMSQKNMNFRTNGRALWPPLFNHRAPRIIEEIASNGKGPLGPVGWAAIVVGDLIVGRENAKATFMLVSMKLTEALTRLSECDR